jgi:hypothetical protein
VPQILFKRRFKDAIRRGDKTTTLRRWKSCRLRRGSRVSVPGVGWLKILSCKQINLKDLTAKDAQADGFSSLKDLLATLAELYPDHKSDGRKWYRVVFRHEEQEAASLANSPQDARTRLADRIRDDLDKAVRSSGSLFPL